MDKDAFIQIDPETSEIRKVHHLLLGGVAPRPIALVSTVSKEGIHNLSPFSFFNAFGANPPYVAFSPSFSGKTGAAKDTLLNVKEIPECVIQAVTFDMVEQVSLASGAYPRNVDEFIKSGLTPVDSKMVKPKRVKESPFQMECKVEQILSLGGKNASGNLVLCKVLLFHVKEEIYKNEQIDLQSIDLVGRNSGNYYTRASGNAIFEVMKPLLVGIGIDQLPEHIKTSKILSANNLAQLGGLSEIPTDAELRLFLLLFQNIENMGDQEPEYKQLCFRGLKNKDAVLLEKAAKVALENGDTIFAMNALLSIPII